MTTLRLALAAFMCLGLLCCCSTKKDSKPADAPDTVKAGTTGSTPDTSEPPADFSCRVGSGGGITGMWSGHTMEAGGSVLSWEGRTAGDDPQPTGRLDAERIRTLWGLVRDHRFFQIESDTRGNMTYMIEVTAGGRTHTAYWAAGASPKQPAVEGTLNELRTALFDVLSKAGQ